MAPTRPMPTTPRVLLKTSACVLLAIPFALVQGGVCLGYVPGQGQHHGDGVLGCGDGISAGGIENDDPLFGRSLYIHIVYAHTGSAYYSEPFRGIDDISRYLGSAADYQGIVVWDLLDELLWREVGDNIDISTRLQSLHAILC